MDEANNDYRNQLRHRVQRRRHRSRSSGLKRLLQPLWYEMRSMVRNPLYLWTLAAVLSLGLLFWLAGIVLPSSDPNRFRPGNQGPLAR
ncbi:MAG: hypothetical protein NTV57_17885 [Cyanobacteria bacterium]|nr:hypothetical protein [Cyanobacteriota bacterium]